MINTSVYHHDLVLVVLNALNGHIGWEYGKPPQLIFNAPILFKYLSLLLLFLELRANLLMLT